MEIFSARSIFTRNILAPNFPIYSIGQLFKLMLTKLSMHMYVYLFLYICAGAKGGGVIQHPVLSGALQSQQRMSHAKLLDASSLSGQVTIEEVGPGRIR